jgi:voltage-gated potassium channel
MVPVTTFGRVLAVMLMLSGILILGVTTATVVSYFNDAVGRSGSGPRRERQHDGTRDEEERQ